MKAERCHHGWSRGAPRCPYGCIFTRGRRAPVRVAKRRIPAGVKVRPKAYGEAGRIGEVRR